MNVDRISALPPSATAPHPASSAVRRESLVERSLALRDSEAIAWLGSRGLWCEPRGQLHLFADRLVDGPFELVRIWHTPARLGRRAPSEARETLVQIDGSVVVSAEASPVVLEPGGVALLPSATVWRMDADAATARIEIRSRRSVWDDEVARHDIDTLGAISAAFREVLVATAISALSSSLRPEDPGFTSFRLAVENLVAGLPAMREHVADDGSADWGLWRQARAVIAAEASDADLTVASLAERLIVSERRLQRAFAERGSSPLTDIRSARAALAQHYLDGASDGRGTRSRAEIARLSGFRTVRAMNEALRRSR